MGKEWTTADGSKIKICDMSDAHLRNSIAFVERKPVESREALLHAAYRTLILLRGDIAIDITERAIQSLEGKCDYGDYCDHEPMYSYLLREAHSRELIILEDYYRSGK